MQAQQRRLAPGNRRRTVLAESGTPSFPAIVKAQVNLTKPCSCVGALHPRPRSPDLPPKPSYALHPRSSNPPTQALPCPVVPGVLEAVGADDPAPTPEQAPGMGSCVSRNNRAWKGGIEAQRTGSKLAGRGRSKEGGTPSFTGRRGESLTRGAALAQRPDPACGRRAPRRAGGSACGEART